MMVRASVLRSMLGASLTCNAATVKLLHFHLDTLRFEFAKKASAIHQSSHRQRKALKRLLFACEKDLDVLYNDLSKYKSLQTKSPRLLDKILFSSSKQGDIRTIIARHSDRLKSYTDGLHTESLGRIENRIELQLRESESQAQAMEETMEGIIMNLNALRQDLSTNKRGPSTVLSPDARSDQKFVNNYSTEANIELYQKGITKWLGNIGASRRTTERFRGIVGPKPVSGDCLTLATEIRSGSNGAVAEVRHARAVSPAQTTLAASNHAPTRQRSATSTAAEAQLIPPKPKPTLAKVPSSRSTSSSPSRRDSGIVLDDPAESQGLSPSRDTGNDFGTDDLGRSTANAKSQAHVSTNENMVENTDCKPDLSTLTAKDYVELLMKGKRPVFATRHSAPKLLNFSDRKTPGATKARRHCISITVQEASGVWERMICLSDSTLLRVFSKGPTNPMRCCSLDMFNLVLSVRVEYPPHMDRQQRRTLDSILCQTSNEGGDFQVELMDIEDAEADVDTYSE
jgi:hypothetical protein